MVEPGAISILAIPIWSQFIDLMKWGLGWLATATGSLGVGIILFTLLVKLALTPLTVKSIKSSRAMQDLQPKIKALQKRHGNDRQKVSSETMLLYQQHGVNPLSGCLPVLFQLPIFWGLYMSIRALSTQSDGRFGESFLWLPSLAQPDPLHILPIVAMAFQFIQTWMSLPIAKNAPTDPQQRMMTQMMQILPFTVVIFGWNFASGLVLYWAAQSVFSAVQQYFITGWGRLRDWLPFLPDVARYTPPTDDIDESKVIVAGSDGSRPPAAGGLWGLINRQIEKVDQQKQGEGPESSEGDANGASPKANGRAKDRSRIIVNNTTSADTRDGSAAPPQDNPAGEAPREGGAKRSSRIIVTESKGNVKDPPAAPADGTERNGSTVPRKGRSRR